MSFLFNKEHESGVEVTYWELISVTVDRLSKVAAWRIGGWVNQAARTKGKEPLMVEDFDLRGESYPLDPAGPAEAALTALFETMARRNHRFGGE